MIVYRPLKPLKRPRKRAQSTVQIPAPVIVRSRKRGRYDVRPDPVDHAEADARVSAFFARMGLRWPIEG
jgi:hypothetical protein